MNQIKGVAVEKREWGREGEKEEREEGERKTLNSNFKESDQLEEYTYNHIADSRWYSHFKFHASIRKRESEVII